MRIISQVVYERETRAIENMENMGMKKFNYIAAGITFYYILYFIYGLLLCLLVRVAILKNTNYLLILLIYYVFIYSFISLAFMISCFFTNTKRAVILGLVIFFVLYIFAILRDTFYERGEFATTILALSPLGSL